MSNTAGLRPFRAPDTFGGTVPIAARVSPDDRDWLDTLPGGRSYHVRQAITVYRQLREGSLSIERQQAQPLPDLDVISKLVLEDVAQNWMSLSKHDLARTVAGLFLHHVKRHVDQL